MQFEWLLVSLYHSDPSALRWYMYVKNVKMLYDIFQFSFLTQPRNDYAKSAQLHQSDGRTNCRPDRHAH